MAQDQQAQIDSLKSQVSEVEGRLKQIAGDDPTLNLRFILIRKTTDIAAFVALILSAFAMYLTLQSYFAKSDLQLFQPRQIVLYNSDFFKPEVNFGAPPEILFAAITSYANRASKDHPAIVMNEFIRVAVDGNKVQHWLYEIGNSEFTGPFKFQTSATRPIPFIIGGNNGFSHEVLFQPFLSPYCLPRDQECTGSHTWYKFVQFIDDLKASHRINVTLGAELDYRIPSLVNCSAAVSDDQINILGSDWKLVVDCDPNQSDNKGLWSAIKRWWGGG
jgi:hypothetical protein